MTKFADNNTVALNNDMTFFFVNKKFHSRMFFSSDSDVIYEIARKRIQVVKVTDIINVMKNVLNLIQ